MLTEDQSAQLKLLANCVARRQLTQKDLARATGVDQSQISRILAGGARRASKNVLKLCKYAEGLGVPKGVVIDRGDDVVRAMQSLLGGSAEESRRLLEVVTSLKAWRESWRAKG